MDKPREGAEEMVIMPLGGGQEVGRSCILLQYQGRNIMLDCGCHPGKLQSSVLSVVFVLVLNFGYKYQLQEEKGVMGSPSLIRWILPKTLIWF